MNKEEILKISKRETLVEAIAQKLISYIAVNRLKEGEQLPSERELIELIGVSRIPLREALCMLKGLGIIEAKHGKGIFVKEIDLSTIFGMLSPLLKVQNGINMEDILQVRFYLEGDIAEIGACKRTEENLKKLGSALEGMKETISSIKRFVRYDMDFHSELARSTQNKIFHLFISSLTDLLCEVQFRYPDTKKHREVSLEYHREIFEAVKGKNPERARKLMQEHIETVWEAICRS